MTLDKLDGLLVRDIFIYDGTTTTLTLNSSVLADQQFTSTGVTATTISDSTRTGANKWVLDEHIGKTLYMVDGTALGFQYKITDNTTTSLTVAGVDLTVDGVLSGDLFQIREPPVRVRNETDSVEYYDGGTWLTQSVAATPFAFKSGTIDITNVGSLTSGDEIWVEYIANGASGVGAGSIIVAKGTNTNGTFTELVTEAAKHTNLEMHDQAMVVLSGAGDSFDIPTTTTRTWTMSFSGTGSNDKYLHKVRFGCVDLDTGSPASGAPTAIQITVDGTALFGTAADAMSYMQTSPSNYLAASTNYERYYEFVFPLKFQTSVVVAITSHGTLPTDVMDFIISYFDYAANTPPTITDA